MEKKILLAAAFCGVQTFAQARARTEKILIRKSIPTAKSGILSILFINSRNAQQTHKKKNEKRERKKWASKKKEIQVEMGGVSEGAAEGQQNEEKMQPEQFPEFQFNLWNSSRPYRFHAWR